MLKRFFEGVAAGAIMVSLPLLAWAYKAGLFA